MYSRFRANWKMSSSLMSDGAGCAKAGFAPSGAATEAPRPNRAKPFRDWRRDRLASMGPSWVSVDPSSRHQGRPRGRPVESDALSTKRFPRQRSLLGTLAHVQRSSLPAHRQVLAARRLLPLRVAAGPSLSWLVVECVWRALGVRWKKLAVRPWSFPPMWPIR